MGLNDQENINTQLLDKKPQNKLYAYRWVIVVVFAILSFQNMMVWSVFSPIQRKLQESYQLSYATINFGTTVIQNYAAIPGTLLANYLFDYHGIGPGLIAGGAMTVLGLWVRVLCTENFWFIIIGQAIGGLAQPLFVNTTQTISSIWFGQNERVWTTSLMNIFLSIGTGIGGLVPQFYVTAAPGSEALEQVRSMMILMAIIATALSIPAFVLVRSRPPTPPSDEINIERFSFFKSLKDLFANKNSFIFLIASGFIYGTMLTESYVFQAQFDPFGFKEDSASTVFALSNVVCIPFYLLAGVMLRYFKSYKKALIVLAAFWSISLFSLIPVSYTREVWLIGAYYIYITCVACPPIALCLEYIVELSYPVGETAAGGMFTVVSQQISSLVAVFCDLVLGDNTELGSNMSYVLLGGFSVVGLIMIFFVKDDLRRTNMLKKNEVKERVISSAYQEAGTKKKTFSFNPQPSENI